MNVQGGDTEINYNEFINNKAENSGGGLYVYGSNYKITHNNITHNQAEKYHGGGLMISGNNRAFSHVEANIIENNTSKQEGGGIYLKEGKFVIRNNENKNNKGSQSGGVFQAWNVTVEELDTNTFELNTPDDHFIGERYP